MPRYKHCNCVVFRQGVNGHFVGTAMYMNGGVITEFVWDDLDMGIKVLKILANVGEGRGVRHLTVCLD